MTKMPRTTPLNFSYHVITRGNNKQDVFSCDADYTYYFSLLAHYKNKYKFNLYHYVLMKNHVHLLMEPTIEFSLSKIMQGVNLAYTYYFRKKYGGVGHLWQGRFKSMLIANEAYFFKCAAYIELNPFKAGLATHPKDYKWSSYGIYTADLSSSIITLSPIYLSLGENQIARKQKYIDFIQNMMSGDLEKIKVELYVNRETVPR